MKGKEQQEQREQMSQKIEVRKWDILRIVTTLLDQDDRKYEDFARVDYIGNHGCGAEIHLSYEREEDVPVTGGIIIDEPMIGDCVLMPVIIEQSEWTVGRKSITTEVVPRDEEIRKKKFGRDGLSTLNILHG